MAVNNIPPVYRLRDLEGSLIKITKRRQGHVVQYQETKDFKKADGVRYFCPVCFHVNGGPVGTHGCLHWFVGKVKDDDDPGPGRWNPRGTSIDDLTFVAPGAYSVHMVGHWHGFIENGTVRVDGVSSTYKKVPQPKKKPSKRKKR